MKSKYLVNKKGNIILNWKGNQFSKPCSFLVTSLLDEKNFKHKKLNNRNNEIF